MYAYICYSNVKSKPSSQSGKFITVYIRRMGAGLSNTPIYICIYMYIHTCNLTVVYMHIWVCINICIYIFVYTCNLTLVYYSLHQTNGGWPFEHAYLTTHMERYKWRYEGSWFGFTYAHIDSRWYDDDVYLDKLQTRGIKKCILYMWNVDKN
jgi:hypothetical protein